MSILLITIGHFFQKTRVLVYRKQKFSKLNLNKKRSTQKKKTFLIIPKLLIFLLAISEELNETGNSRINKIKENDIFLGCNYSIRNDFVFHEYQLYAISELKYKSNETFCR